MKTEAKSMLNQCIAELADMRKCCDCFFNRDIPNAVELVCAKPHLALWVRYGDWPWWPAKLLSVGNDNYPLEVEFFGDFSSASVTYTDCLLYSHADPNARSDDAKDTKFYGAIDVNFYIFITQLSVALNRNLNRLVMMLHALIAMIQLNTRYLIHEILI